MFNIKFVNFKCVSYVKLIKYFSLSQGFEFSIVSLDNRQWQFEASSLEEREEWVTAIEQQILASLQGINALKPYHNSEAVARIKTQVLLLIFYY